MMQEEILEITNHQGERLEVVMSGNTGILNPKIIVFVHGLLSDLHENFKYFDDLAEMLGKDFITIRFSFAGCGNSEGKQEDYCLWKNASDLEVILEFAKMYGNDISIIAHSLGCFAVSYLCPANIRRVVFTSPANPDTLITIKGIQERITKQGEVVYENGTTIYPRTNGSIQKLGPQFWKDLKSFRPIESVTSLAVKTKLLLIKPNKDEVVRNEASSAWRNTIGKMPIGFFSLSGDHNFSDPKDRSDMVRYIEMFLE